MPERVFSCRKCGHCCEGQGGIVLSGRDQGRLAAFLNLAEAAFVARYVEYAQGKPRIRSGADGFCVFFEAGKGCGVHPAKPDVCRAWPFFRGNLIDPASLAMAREFCPGIARDVAFSDFAAIGRQWLRQSGLASSSAPANALHCPDCENGAVS